MVELAKRPIDRLRSSGVGDAGEVREVDALPAVPSAEVPVGTVLRLKIDGRLYRCEGEKWMPVEVDDGEASR